MMDFPSHLHEAGPYYAPNRAALKILFDFLLELLEIPKGHDSFGANAPFVSWNQHAESYSWTFHLAELADNLGLITTEHLITAKIAANIATPMTPAITYYRDSLNTEGWLVLYGIQRGRARAAFITAAGINTKRLRTASIERFLEVPAHHPFAWLLLQPAAPLEAAVSHGPEHHQPPLRRLFALLKPERRDIWLVVVFAALIGLLSLATPIAVQAVVNLVALAQAFQPLLALSIMLFVLLSFSSALQIAQIYLVEVVQRRLFVRVAADLAWRLPRVHASFYDRSHGAELVNRFLDVLTVQKAAAALLLEGVSLALQVFTSVILLSFYHPYLLAFNTLLIVSIAYIMFGLGRGAIKTVIKESKIKYQMVAWLEEIAHNQLAFKFNHGPQLAQERVDAIAHEYLNARHGHFRILLRQNIGALALYTAASTALLAIGSILVMEKQLTLGQLVAAELIVSAVLASFAKLGKQLEVFYDLMAAVDKLGHLIDIPTERRQGIAMEGQRTRPATVLIQDVNFTHNSGTRVLRAFNLSLMAGERVALLGVEGSGKSTLADLLTGQREPQEGRIELEGFNLQELKLDTLRRRIALVRHVEIFEDTILENLRVGRYHLDIDQLRGALDAVGLLNEFRNLPEGLQTHLATNGAPLSTGQLRRLMIARAIVGYPSLLVIDSLLDEMEEESFRRISSTLLSPQAPWTLLLLTRNPGIATLCGRVVHLSACQLTVSARKITDG
jgi:putative ABC transport system ATP-binding protein